MLAVAAGFACHMRCRRSLNEIDENEIGQCQNGDAMEDVLAIAAEMMMWH
jgi:hypothetical protein